MTGLDERMEAMEAQHRAALISEPPPGKCRVTNLYVDPLTGRLVVEYDDVPA